MEAWVEVEAEEGADLFENKEIGFFFTYFFGVLDWPSTIR